MIFSFVKNPKKAPALLCGLFAFFVLFDQLVKKVVVAQGEGAFLCNYGVAFGLVLPQMLFVVLWGVIMIFVLYYWFVHKKEKFSVQIPFVLIASGGISNMIDRLYYGCVIDYVPFLSISSFNFADMLISFGAFLWVRQIFVSKNKKTH